MPGPDTPNSGPQRLDAAVAAERAASLMRGGFCCSESVFAAICEQVQPGFDRSRVALASGFCGGIGHTHEEICGALAGGIMAIGLLYGRSEQTADDSACATLARLWRESFREQFGTTRCGPIYDRMHQPGAPGSCAETAGQAAALLVALLNGGRA